MVKCKRCGCVITDKHWNSKYCSDCAIEKKQQYDRWYVNRGRELGTTCFKQRRCKDFDKELAEINKEFMSLGLQRDKLYKKVK